MDRDHWGEIVALGIDAIIFGFCSKMYLKYSYAVNLVERANRVGINPEYSDLNNESRMYVIYQGDVAAVGKPIKGLNAPDITGVVQRLTIREHVFARNTSGFWADQKNVLQEAYNVVPFLLQKGSMSIRILDPLSAEILDLDTVHNKFENSSLSLMDHVFGFFNGMRQRGIETTEELLKEGSVITAIGEVSQSEEGLQLSPPSRGYPYFITSLPVNSLIRKLEEQKSSYKWLTVLCGGVGLALTVVIVKRWWKLRQTRLRDEELRRRLERTRKERRRNARSRDNLGEGEKCVVCKENPKEIIILPCGHVCICEDCSDMIKLECPVCRAAIESKAAAFIS